MKALQYTLLQDCIIGMEYVACSTDTQWPSDQDTPMCKNSVKLDDMKALQYTLLQDCIIGKEYLACSTDTQWPIDQETPL